MERPNSPQLDTLLATVEELRLQEARLAELKALVATQAQALSQIANKASRIEAAIYAYWYAPEVHASDLALGATGRAHPGRLLKAAGPVSVGVPCDRCGEDLPIRSRNEMKETQERLRSSPRWAEGYRVLCLGCEEAVLDARRLASDRQDKARAARCQVLAALPYADYLRTPEWRDAMAQHLWFRAHEFQNLGCEACGSEEERGVYHKSLDDLGHADDVVLLCATCRGALAGAGKLAGEPGPQNRLKDADAERILAERFADLQA
ncbi:hypothetical protein ACO2Q0_11290 [Phenylobacterium sp. VNQ135]|uniref:hypothetical protein n=1 Tax=Phenylobacterium sp. VNQ135 TaxID=3400922 RepID=UPI003C0AB134